MANFFSRLIHNVFQSNEVADDAFYEGLEDAMIMSDVGVTTTLKIVDRAYILENGSINGQGMSAELLASDYIQKTYLGLE